MAYKFNGTNQYINGNYGSNAAVPLTFSCWFYRATSSAQALVSLASSTSSDFFMMYEGGGVLYASSYQSGIVRQAGTSTGLKNNSWNHGAARYESATSRYSFLNGNKSSQNTDSSTPNNSNIFVLAAQNIAGSYSYFCGQSICEVAIWEASLTDDEIAILSKGFSPLLVRPQSLKLYTPLIRNLSDIRANISLTNNNNATVIEHTRNYGI